MQISVTARHMDITDAIRTYAEDKVGEELSEFTRLMSVHVILDIEKYRHIAEIVAEGSHHIRIEAESTSDDMYVSIDQAVEKAAKQLRRSRDKIQDHKHRESLAEVELEVQAASKQADS